VLSTAAQFAKQFNVVKYPNAVLSAEVNHARIQKMVVTGADHPRLARNGRSNHGVIVGITSHGGNDGRHERNYHGEGLNVGHIGRNRSIIKAMNGAQPRIAERSREFLEKWRSCYQYVRRLGEHLQKLSRRSASSGCGADKDFGIENNPH
jgi:hypothetical protein